MRAVVVEGRGGISVKEVSAPEPGPGEAIVDVRCAGICGTDLELARGYMDFTGIPGHEFVGTVSAVGSRADSLLVGARVVGEINVGCEECPQCAEGLSRHCRRRRVLGILGKDGAFAEQLTLPVRNLHAVPESLPDEKAVFVEPAAAAFEILDQVSVERAQRVLVLGDGRLGLLAAQAIATRQCEVTVAGHHDDKLERARAFGLRTLCDPAPSGPPGYDLVVEATGSPDALEQALRCVRPRGVVVMKTTCAGPTSFEAWRAVVDEITLIGSRCGRFEPAIAALTSGAVKVDGLVTQTMPLEEAVAAFQAAGEPDSLKVLLRAAS